MIWKVFLSEEIPVVLFCFCIYLLHRYKHLIIHPAKCYSTTVKYLSTFMGIKCARTYHWQKKSPNLLSGLMTCGSAARDLKVNCFLLLGGSDNVSLWYITQEISKKDHSNAERQLRNLTQCSANKITSLAVWETYFYTKRLSVHS